MDHHTIATLAEALRGTPRSARILVEMPDGKLLPVLEVTGRNTLDPGVIHREGAGYEVILRVSKSG
jgi:hypothetical protein